MTKILGYLAGAIITIIIFLLMALGAASEFGYVPSPDTLSKNEIPKKTLSTLAESKIIDVNEDVYYFYSAGLLSVLEDGNLFTNKRVLSYETIEGNFNIYSAYYNDIADISLDKSEEHWGTSEIKVTSKDGTWFILYVDNEKEKDTKFFEKLNDIWQKAKA